ncbi:response regulator, partial [bacterium]|nr:response regulator [bacterium]
MAKKGTILIVEDDERYCRRYQKMLSGQAYHIKITMDIPAAEAELNRLHPDVVLLDLRFPPLDNPEEGLSFLEIVKNLDPFIKVIVVTGVSDREIALKAIERGAYDFVQKDTKQRTELAFRVNQAFEKAQLERELVAFKQKQVSQIGGYFYGPG